MLILNNTQLSTLQKVLTILLFLLPLLKSAFSSSALASFILAIATGIVAITLGILNPNKMLKYIFFIAAAILLIASWNLYFNTLD